MEHRRWRFAILVLLALLVPLGGIAQEAEDEESVAPSPEDFFGGEWDALGGPAAEDDGGGESDDQEDADTNGAGAGASNGSTSADDDWGNNMFDVVPSTGRNTAPEADLLQNEEGVRWGGSFGGGFEAEWSWDDSYTSDFGLFDPYLRSMSPVLSADLFFDGRPDTAFRVYGKFNLEATLQQGTGLPEGTTATTDEDGNLVISDDDGDDGGEDEEEDERENEQWDPRTGTTPTVALSVVELFADFNIDETVFFRFGKHTIRWGVGYFFSPTDVLNLTSIDPEDPTAEREGPISLKAQIPFDITGNLYLYTIVNDDIALADTALAPKVEFAVGNGELGVGLYYQSALAPRLALTATYSALDLDFFAEGLLSWGSDRVYVRPSRDQSAAQDDPDDDLDLVLDTYEVDAGLFPSATFGVRFSEDFEAGGSIILNAEYYFNGDGYPATSDYPYAADPYSAAELRQAALRLFQNPAENGLAVDEEDQSDDYEAPPALSVGDLNRYGRHYLAGSVSMSDVAETGLGVSVLTVNNLTDLSGFVDLRILWEIEEVFELSFGPRFSYGPAAGEYTNPEAFFAGDDERDIPTFSLGVDLSVTGGLF